MPFVAHRIFGWKPIEIDESWGLKTIKHGMGYSICNSLCCSNCGLLFLDMRFSDSELSALYHEYRGVAYTELRENYEPGYEARNYLLNFEIEYINKIEEFLRPHLTTPLRILDWGGDTGKNTPFRHANDILHVFDISSKPVVAGAIAVDKKIAFGTVYNLIICSNVLEHVPYPSDIIIDIKRCMNKETILYVEVPYEDIIRVNDANNDNASLKKHWHEHINFYTEDSLRYLLCGCGFKIIQLRTLSVSVGGSAASIFQMACKLN